MYKMVNEYLKYEEYMCENQKDGYNQVWKKQSCRKCGHFSFSLFSSLETPYQPTEKTDLIKQSLEDSSALFKPLGLHAILGCIMIPIKMLHSVLLVQRHMK